MLLFQIITQFQYFSFFIRRLVPVGNRLDLELGEIQEKCVRGLIVARS